MRKCECGAWMQWHWGYKSWLWVCSQCGNEEEVKVPEVDLCWIDRESGGKQDAD